MTPSDLRKWQAHMSLTYDSAAQQLGVVRSTYARWVAPHGQPPRAVALACAAVAAGLEPWPGKATVQAPAKRARSTRP